MRFYESVPRAAFSCSEYYLALARIRVGVSEERVGEVPGLSATSLSVLATLSGRSVGASNSSTCTSTSSYYLG